MLRIFRVFLISLLAAAAAQTASAHFVFVVPDPAKTTAKVILSEDLTADDDVPIDLIGGTKLIVRDASGTQTPLKLKKGEHEYLVDIPGTGSRVIYGITELGVRQRGNSKPFLLIYHPKTIIGDAFDQTTLLGTSAVAEIVAVGKPGQVKFEMRARGKAQAGLEINLILPDGTHKKMTTDQAGQTDALTLQGRYGAWCRYVEPAGGERGGEKFDETRHYATFVADIGITQAPNLAATTLPSKAPFISLPQAVSSFGAVASEGWLYVYGGHAAPTHVYSTEAVSGQFHRLNLADPKKWERLPDGPAVQGMNLAAYGGKIFRVGGMECRNKPGTRADTYSVADAARFDPATGKWEPLPALPEPRSSHDATIVDGKLFIVGGWRMDGKAGEHWLDTAQFLDLNAPEPKWQSIKQPFHRRALTAASYEHKLYVLGGFSDEDEASLRVEIYDPAAGAWTTGPDLPAPQGNGFAPAACTVANRLYVSVADGTLYRLDETGKTWQKIAQTTPRIVHRLAPDGSHILVMGGAAKGENMSLIEAVEIP